MYACVCIFHSTVKEVFIVTGLKSTDVFVGEWATFSCQLSGRAPAKVQWWLDGTLLENSPCVEIGVEQSFIHTLTFKNLATDDSGTVIFKTGSLTSSAKLLVKGILFMDHSFAEFKEIIFLTCFYVWSSKSTKKKSRRKINCELII